MDDDLFSDNAETKRPPLNDTDDSQTRFKAHEAKVNAAVERNMAIMEAAESHLRAVKAVQTAVFGDTQAYAEFTENVEKRLQQDESFSDKYAVMSEVYEQVIDHLHQENQRYEPVRKNAVKNQAPGKKLTSSAVFIPGNPVSPPAESATSKRNHILRKDMI